MTAAEQDEVVDYDFDEAWRERKAARVAPRIRLLGKVYTLPNSLPAKLILFAVSARRAGRVASEEVNAEEAFDMLAALLGESNLRDLLDRGLEIDDLPDLLGTCQRVYQERQSGNGSAPATTGANGSTPSA
ncbi:hypothetical protein GCM10010174_22960 [Kutzneria viridogrisea]|uniref:Tail assembly chaperone n=1 Tax=Kutzneria viridogrisea TaxID=47990 RepID=A0ABR6BSM9_9PSEU|nr:hypothetical protein [Kutzneria viridogrisea]